MCQSHDNELSNVYNNEISTLLLKIINMSMSTAIEMLVENNIKTNFQDR